MSEDNTPIDWNGYLGQRILVTVEPDSNILEATPVEISPKGFIKLDPIGWRDSSKVKLLETLPGLDLVQTVSKQKERIVALEAAEANLAQATDRIKALEAEREALKVSNNKQIAKHVEAVKQFEDEVVSHQKTKKDHEETKKQLHRKTSDLEYVNEELTRLSKKKKILE